jgi:hypothetical protein
MTGLALWGEEPQGGEGTLSSYHALTHVAGARRKVDGMDN